MLAVCIIDSEERNWPASEILKAQVLHFNERFIERLDEVLLRICGHGSLHREEE